MHRTSPSDNRMATDPTYSDAELERYFQSPDRRHGSDGSDDDLADFFQSPDTPARSSAPTERASLENGLVSPQAPSPRRPSPRRPSKDRRPTDKAQDPVKRRVRRVLAGIASAIGVAALIVALVLFWFSRDLPSLEQIENPSNLLATTVLTSDGTELARYYEGENRTWVPLEEIAPAAQLALLATEDRRFYDHWGVDLYGLAAVAVGALRGEGIRGASTLTMQLARNLYREQVDFTLGDRSVVRKIKEVLTALRIERIYTKDEILEAYLNTVPFRYNAYGIEAASQTYFAKTAADLAPEEAATLIGMLAANTRYDPKRNPENSRRRRNVVLQNMAVTGALSQREVDELQQLPITLNFEPYSHEDNMAPHFAEVLRLWFTDWAKRNGYDPYRDGLVIRTTLDSRMQQIATDALRETMRGLQAVVDVEWGGYGFLGSTPEPYLRRVERGGVKPFRYWWNRNTALVNEYVRGTSAYQRLRDGGRSREEAVAELRRNETFMDSLKTVKTRLEGGLVAIEPQTGRVRAWVGGRDYVMDQFDHVGQARRQPGSTFKLFAYTAAFDNGYSPQATALDARFTWRIPGLEPWSPQNSGGGYSGVMTLAQGMQYSKNVVAARVTRALGADEVKAYAERLGVRSPIEAVRSIALGTSDVTLLEMVNAYATIANYGVYHGPPHGVDVSDPTIPPHIVLAIDRIEDRYGNVIEDFSLPGREVLSPSTAYTVVDALRNVVDAGTARRLKPAYNLSGYDLGGKTGTTQESADGWFVAIHPQLAVGSWVGFNDRRITFRTSYWGQGAHTGMLNVGAFLERLAEADGGMHFSKASRFEEPENYQPPQRITRLGGSYWSGARQEDPNQESDRPAGELLDRWDEVERQRDGGDSEDGGGGRIGW